MEKLKGFTAVAYFKEELQILKQGAQMCFSEMEICDINNSGDHTKILNLAELLTTSIKIFCTNHLKCEEELNNLPDSLNLVSKSKAHLPSENSQEAKLSPQNRAPALSAATTSSKSTQTMTLPQDQNRTQNQKIRVKYKKIRVKDKKIRVKHKKILERIQRIKLSLLPISSTLTNHKTTKTFTILTVKNPLSYRLVAAPKVIKVVENGATVYSSSNFLRSKSVRKVIYTEVFNCYLFLSDDYHLYAKAIDQTEPRLFDSKLRTKKLGSCLRFSEMNQRLIVNKELTNIAIVNLMTGKIELELKNKKNHEILDFEIFGEKEERVLCCTRDGLLLLYDIFYSLKNGCLTCRKKLESRGFESNHRASLTICDRNRYVFVHVGRQGNSQWCLFSAIFVFEIDGDQLRHIETIDQFQCRGHHKFSFNSFGYIGGHVLLVGVLKDQKDRGMVLVYDFDTQKSTLTELEDKRILYEWGGPENLSLVGTDFIY